MCKIIKTIQIIAIYALFLFFSQVVMAQNRNYDTYDEIDSLPRFYSFYVGGAGLLIKGTGFRDVDISDYEANPTSPNSARVKLSRSNFDALQGGLALGFMSMKAGGWGFGGEGEFFIFDNSSVLQFAVYANYGLFFIENIVLGPYAKLGYSLLSVEFDKVNSNTSNPVELSRVARNRGRNAVDVREGDVLKGKSEAFYAQFGLHILLRIQEDFSLFLQVGYQNEIDVSKKLELQVNGVRREKSEITGQVRDVESSFRISFDDRALVNSGTNEPARLNPALKTGPWYFSLSAGYTF